MEFDMVPRITASAKVVRLIEAKRQYASRAGNLSIFKKASVIKEVIEGTPYQSIAETFCISVDTVRIWINKFLINGEVFLSQSTNKRGRFPKLTKAQKNELFDLIKNGPESSGYPGGCWRSPMIQHLIERRYGVFYSAKYISQLLKNMGLSFQKATFETAFKDEEKRKLWLKKTWPEILEKCKKMGALILFEDEASFPMWGSLSYTWAPKGQQPKIKTSGLRKGYKVFGAIEYNTGKFYHQEIEERFSSETYIDFIKMILSKTRQHVILIHDGAPYHKSSAVKDFIRINNRLTEYRLPTYSPDYNPIEKLWKKVKQNGIHLKYFPDFSCLKQAVDCMFEIVENAKDEILKLFGFYKRREI
jgi:transposase